MEYEEMQMCGLEVILGMQNKLGKKIGHGSSNTPDLKCRKGQGSVLISFEDDTTIYH